jgi:hypothetical protein
MGRPLWILLLTTATVLAAPLPKDLKKSKLSQKDLAGMWICIKCGNSTGESKDEMFEPVLLVDDEGRGSYELVKLKSKEDCVLELKPEDGPGACDWVTNQKEQAAIRYRCVVRVEGDALLLVRPLDPVTEGKDTPTSRRPTEAGKDSKDCIWMEFRRQK